MLYLKASRHPFPYSRTNINRVGFIWKIFCLEVLSLWWTRCAYINIDPCSLGVFTLELTICPNIQELTSMETRFSICKVELCFLAFKFVILQIFIHLVLFKIKFKNKSNWWKNGYNVLRIKNCTIIKLVRYLSFKILHEHLLYIQRVPTKFAPP